MRTNEFHISLLMKNIVTSRVSGVQLLYDNPLEPFKSKVLPPAVMGFEFSFEVSQNIGVFP
jgi:hypothetical protein